MWHKIVILVIEDTNVKKSQTNKKERGLYILKLFVVVFLQWIVGFMGLQ